LDRIGIILVEKLDDLRDILPLENILIAEFLIKLRSGHRPGFIDEESLESTLTVLLERVLGQVNRSHEEVTPL
jgi:hypothetical protein